uniref:Copia protein n=1 Tax=Lygus hesperus TaxID=30085 RepID=A0A0A9WGW7_LYGHE
MYISQQAFTRSIINKFGLANAKIANTPMAAKDSEGKKMVGEESSESVPYRQAIGSLLYLQNCTRPDITYAENVLSLGQSNLDESDWSRVKRVIKYLRGTLNYGLMYRGGGESIVCYPDASLGINDEMGQSTSDFVIALFYDVIGRRTRKQNLVVLFSAEAEFVEMSLACSLCM